MEQQNSQPNQTESQVRNAAGTTPSPVATALRREDPEWVTEVIEALGETTIIVPREYIADICALLKTAPDFQFNFLADLCGFDRGPEEEPRFEVNYHLFSTTKHHRVRLNVLLNEDNPRVPRVTLGWPTANWPDRGKLTSVGVA